MRKVPSYVALAFLLCGATARANSQPPILYDGRSAGMAGTGVAFNDSGAAAFHNPANLQSIKDMAATATFAPYYSILTTPWPDPTTGRSVQMDATAFTPLSQLGLATRINARLVTGLNAFILAGSGATYEKVLIGESKDVSASLMTAELQIPVALHVLDGLDVGVAYRISYAMQTQARYTRDGTMAIPVTKREHGFNFMGLQAGITYSLNPALRFGANWRSQVTTMMHGTTTLGPTGSSVSGKVTDTFIAPHSFSAGVDWTGLDKRLVVAAQYQHWLYKSANHNADTFQDCYRAALGLEYLVTDRLPIRVGYTYGTSATTDKGAQNFTPPPGISMAPTLGAGLNLDTLSVDVAAAYGAYGTTEPATTGGPVAGDYRITAWAGFLSVTYRN